MRLALLLVVAVVGCGPSREARIEQARAEAAVRRDQREEADAELRARKRDAIKEGERRAEQAREDARTVRPCKPFESLPAGAQERLLQFSAANGNWHTDTCCPLAGTQPLAAKACPDAAPMPGVSIVCERFFAKQRACNDIGSKKVPEGKRAQLKRTINDSERAAREHLRGMDDTVADTECQRLTAIVERGCPAGP